MSYDGRYRVGCDGLIYILLEPFFVSNDIIESFISVLKERQSFRTETIYNHSLGEHEGIGTSLILKGKTFSINPAFHHEKVTEQKCFSQTFPPAFQLHIFGAEHDAVHLCRAANLLGWEVTIVASPDEGKSVDYFPGATKLITPDFNNLDTSGYDGQTAIILMTHSFNKDVQYLIALRNIKPAYIGLLGPKSRRDRVLSKFLDYCPDASEEFLDQVHGPVGINIGAENAPEVAVSVVAEILSTIRNQQPLPLKDKAGSIHG
jgi:xanthine/CO dehydrogenase XdhC/CoxF family maturation factor